MPGRKPLTASFWEATPEKNEGYISGAPKFRIGRSRTHPAPLVPPRPQRPAPATTRGCTGAHLCPWK